MGSVGFKPGHLNYVHMQGNELNENQIMGGGYVLENPLEIQLKGK